MKNIIPQYVTLSCLTLMTLVCTCGCTTMHVSDAFQWVPGVGDKIEAPNSLAAIWSNAMLEEPNKRPTRGFGARLMFYGKDNHPVRVSGTLVVYAFDDQHNENLNKPDRKYIFTPDQLAEHYSKSKLGPSYSVFVPWDEAGGPLQQVSLIVRFNPVAGSSVLGNQTRLVLPGPAKPDSPEQPDGVQRADNPSEVVSPVRPIAHYEPPAAHPIPPPRDGPMRRMSTTTITLPSGAGK
jgi:hypothetical protein